MIAPTNAIPPIIKAILTPFPLSSSCLDLVLTTAPSSTGFSPKPNKPNALSNNPLSFASFKPALAFSNKALLFSSFVKGVFEALKVSGVDTELPFEIEEGNEFGAERARAIAAGKDSFTVDGKTYKVTDVDDVVDASFS